MKRSELKAEYRKTLEYYRRTVWEHVKGVRIVGIQLGVANLAWCRFCKAQDEWLNSLPIAERDEARRQELDRDALRPRPLEKDEKDTPELLATLASSRLGTRKPRSFRQAVEEGHGLLQEARDYLKSLPGPRSALNASLSVFAEGSITFDEVTASSAEPGRIALLAPVQAARNRGRLTSRALKLALEREAKHMSAHSQQQIRQALKNKRISGKLLEEIRWRRFQRHL